MFGVVGEKKLNSLDTETKFWQNFSSYKKALYISENAPDCSFVVTWESKNAKTFHAHKSILKSVSTVFANLFDDNAKNSKLIHVHDTEPHVFKKFLDFIYYGDVDGLNCIDATTLQHLIRLGKKYEIDDLIKDCISVMKLNLANTENSDLISIFEYACLNEDNELINECKRVIVGRTKSNRKFQDFNFSSLQEEKRHIMKAKLQIKGPHQASPKANEDKASSGSNVFGAASTSVSSNASKPAVGLFGSVPSTTLFGVTQPAVFVPFGTSKAEEEKLQNTDSSNNTDNNNTNNDNTNKKENCAENFNFSIMPVGINKGKITNCACIYALNPSVFYEFQFTLSGYVSELLRFNMIETYAKINGLIDDNESEKSEGDFNMLNLDEVAEKNNAKYKSTESLNKDNNCSNASSVEFKQKNKIASSKQILNMLLRSIKFYRMSAKEFCSGPGKSSLLDIEEKYDLLATIVNKN